MTRKILHLDLDAFFCAVEELRDTALCGLPFAVGGRPEERGVVSSCSYAARQFGVRSAMPMARALRICPELRIVPSHYSEYSKVSQQVMQRLRNLTPWVEQISIDEAFLDVSDLTDPMEEIARRLQAQIQSEVSLPNSLGCATNKLVAKIANDVGKVAARKDGSRLGQPPNAITVVPPGQEAAFLAPLPVEALWGVGPKTAERLSELGIFTIGQLAGWSSMDLIRRFGKNGHDISLRAQGIDTSEIVTTHETKSVSQETTFAQDVSDPALLRRTLREQSESIGRRLREDHLYGHTVKLKLRWPDFTTLTRQLTLDQPTDQDDTIYTAALQIFQKHWRAGQAVRLIGVGISGIGPPIRQLTLWDALDAQHDSEKDRRLQAAVDALRARYGSRIVKRGLNDKE